MDYLAYTPQDTYLHRLDPRTKFIFFLVMAVLASVISTGPALTLLMIVFVLIWVTAGLRDHLIRLVNNVKGLILTMAIIWFLVGIFQKNSGPVIFEREFTISNLSIGICFELYDIYKCYCLSLRIILMVASFYIVIVTTNFSDIILGLSKWKVPNGVSFGIGLVFQMIPMITSEFHAIMEAQSSRGLEVEKCGTMDKIKNYVSASFPLLFRVLAKGHALSLSMHFYKLNFQQRRSSYKDIKASRADLWFNLGTLLVAAAAITLNATYNFGF